MDAETPEPRLYLRYNPAREAATKVYATSNQQRRERVARASSLLQPELKLFVEMREVMGGGTLVEELVVELPAFLNQVVFIHELLERECIRVQQGLDGTGLCKAQAPKHDCCSWKMLPWNTQR